MCAGFHPQTLSYCGTDCAISISEHIQVSNKLVAGPDAAVGMATVGALAPRLWMVSKVLGGNPFLCISHPMLVDWANIIGSTKWTKTITKLGKTCWCIEIISMLIYLDIVQMRWVAEKGKTKMDSGHGNQVMGGIPPARFSYHIILYLPLCLSIPSWRGYRSCRFCIASFPLPVSVGIISITTAISWTNMAIGILATRPHKHLQHSSSTWICCCQFFLIEQWIVGHLGMPGSGSPQLKHTSIRCVWGIFHSLDMFNAWNISLASLHGFLMLFRCVES